MIRMDLRLAVIGVILIGIVSSGPVKNLNSKCAVQCTNKNKFSYRVGTIYEYSYEAETKTGVQGSTEEQGGLKVTATAEIEVISKCELILSIKNSNILGSDPDYSGQFKQHPQRKEFQKQLEDQSLRFSFQDGVVEEICPDDSESVWSTNFKRGVLTAFQNSMDSFDQETEVTETDVSGKCLTTYRVIQEGWRTIKVKKSKDLVSCTNRHGFQTSAQATIYSVPSSVQSLPLLKSTQECDQVLSTQGRVESTVCHEIHLFRPFAKKNNGALTEVIQKLTFVTEKRGGGPISGSVNRRESLLYTHHISGTKTSNNKEAALKKLTELCTTTKDGITPATPKLFSELVYILKELNSDDLTEVYEQSQMDSFCIDNSDRVKKFYSDAVPMIGTTAAVKQIAELILRNEITGRMAEIWLSSLSLVQNPSKEMLGEISKLMDLPEGTKVYLPASVMVNTYCKENKNCENLPQVEDIINKLQKAVGSSCIVTEVNYMEVLTSLRAIGNIEFAEKLVPTISECFSKKTNEMEIRVAAVEAYRRMSCGADRNNLMIIYRDDTEDAELRIAAYIQVMKCPTDNIISQVKDTLAGEEVNQVGSFVWTHLTNLMETSLIHKQNIQSILEDETLKKEFDLDKRKFSRNYEWSYFSESLNAGAGVESNLVWSQKSFVPRSAMVNLTVDLFGSSVNLFELGGRVEGLEKILAENFGPKGYFGAKQDMTPEQKSNRAIDFNKIEQIDEKLGKKEDEMKGSAFMRMFGNEISYYNTKQSSDNNIPNGKPFNFLDVFMNLAKEQEFSQKMSKLLLDSSIITPTVTGLPLNLKAVAASTIDLNAKGKMDLRSPSKKIILEGSLMPSGAVEVTSTMTIDAFVTKSGLKMASTFHTSTAVTAKFELDNKQELTMEFIIPKEKSDIVNVQSQFFVVHADVEKEQKMITKNRITKTSCTGHTLARLIGVEFCADMSLPGDIEKSDAPHFPLTGPSKFALSVLKRDTHTSYKFDFKGIMNKRKAVIWMMYDTPGSKVMRKTGFTVEINHQSKDMEINMISPWKTAKFEGNLVNIKKKKAVSGMVTIDSSKKYQAEVSVLITETKAAKIYKPKIEIIRHSADPIVLGGEIVYKPGKVMTSKLVLTGAMEKPASLDLSVRFTKFQYGFTGTVLHSKDQKYTVDVNLEVNSKPKRSIYKPRMIVSIPDKEYINMYGTVDLRSAKGNIVRYDLVVNKLFRTPIKVKGESSIQSKGKRSIYKGKAYFTGPQKITTRVRYVFDKKLRVTTTQVKLDYNFQKLHKNLKDSLQFNSRFMKKSVKTSQKINFSSVLKSARFADYNNRVKLSVDQRPKSKIDADLTVDYGKTYMSKVNKHRLSVLTSTKYIIKPSSGVINYNVTFRLPAEKLDSYFSGTHKYSKKDLKSDLHIRYDNKKSADVSLSLIDSSSKKYFRYSGDLALKYAGRHVQVTGQAIEKEREYSSKWSVQHQAGHTSVFTGAYSWPSDEKRDIVSSIRIDGQEPITIAGSTVMNIQKPEGTIKVKVGKQFYVVSGMGNYNGESFITGQGKINYPGRQIMCDISGGLKNDEYSGLFDLNWNVRDKKGGSRVVLELSFRNNTIEDFGVSARTVYPGRELLVKVQHYSKDRIDTTVAFGWNKDKVISTSMKFNNDKRKYRQMLDGTVSLTTPFKELLEFEIGGNLENTRAKHTHGLTFTWNKGKTVAYQYDIKRPAIVADMDMNLHIQTPYPKIGNPVINIQNKLSDDLIRQEGNLKVTWGNNQFVSIETNGESLNEGPKRKLKRNVGVLTSFDQFKVTTLNFTHEDDLKKFLSQAVYVKDGIKYLYILNMDHSLDGWSMQNTGTFDMSSPFDTLKFVWSHKNTEKNLKTDVEADWGSGHKFSVKANGNLETSPNRKGVAEIDMIIPSSKLSSLKINLEHEDKVGYVKTIGKIIANKENAGTVKLNYARQLGSTDFDFRILSKHMKDCIIDGRTRHAHMPMTGTLKVQWSGKERMFLDGTLHYDKIGTVDSKVELTTPFQKARRLILKTTHKLDGKDWIAESEFEFAPMQKINAAVRYNKMLDQFVRLQVTTPFPQFQRLDTGAYFKYILHPSQWESKMDFEIVPLVGKITSVITWQNDTKSAASFKLNTPFQRIPRMSAEVESEKDITGRRTSKLMLEYLPTQKIELTSNYKLTDGKDFDGSITVKSPFNEEVFATYQQKGYSKNDLKGFNRRVQLKYRRTQNIIIDTTFGTKPRLFGSMEIQMPVRGYETVKLSFTHKGKYMNNFHTTVDYENNGKKIEFETLFNVIDNIRGKMKVTSPFSMKIAQVEYSHEGTPTNFKSHGGVIYNDYKTDADAVFTHSGLQTTGSFTFKSPIEGAKDIMLTFNKDGNLKKLSFNGEAGYETGKKYIVVVKHSLEGKDAATDVVIQNPLTEDIIVKVSYDKRRKGATTIVQGSVGTENSVALETTYKFKNNNLDLEMDLTTVITGEKHVSNLVVEHKGKLNDFTCTGTIKTSYVNMDDQIKIAFKGTDLIDDFNGSLEIKDTLNPISFKTGFKSTRKNNLYVSEANYNANTIKSEVDVQHLKYKGKVTVNTKVEGYENLELDFDQQSTNHKAINKITIKPFNYKPATVEADLLFKGVTWFETDLKFKSGFEGFEVVESKISHKGNWNDFASSFTFKKSDMKPIELVASLNAVVLSNIDGSFKFTSGLEGAEEIEGSFKHTGDLDKLSSNVIVKIPKNQPIQIDMVFDQDLPSKLEGKLSFVSGIEGAKNLELSVEHKIESNDYLQKLVMNMPFNKHVKVVHKYKNEPSKKEAVYLFTSHFKGVENVQLTMVHNGDPMNFVNTITVIPPFNIKSMKMVSKLDMNDDYTDVKGDVKFVSGIEGAEDVHASVTHTGPVNDFANKLVIRPPFMDEMELSTSVKYEEKQLLQMNVDFNSKIVGAEALGFSSNNKLVDDNRITSQSEIKLDKLRKINVEIDGKAKFSQLNSDTEIFGKFDLMTPFEKVRTFNLEYLSDRKSKNVDEAYINKDMLSITHNGKKYYDTQATTEMVTGKSVVYAYNMEAPYQIEYSYDVHFVEPYSADVMVNWNKMEPNSNFKLQGKFENMNDLKVKFIHPTRTVALEGALMKDDDEKSAKMLVTWDADKNQAVGIETKWQDQNRRGLDILDGSIKVTTPFRAVEASGSINKVLMRKSVEGTVFWDADNDKTKKASMRTEVTPDDNGYSGRVHLSLPVIGKEYTLTRQLTKNEGNVLCESTTEFSYSSDPRKTIVFTSKLEDLSTTTSTNHSYTFGVAQAFTSVDTSFTVHLGSSDKLDSTGVLVKYQTSELQKKNLLLLAEIDKLEKKIIIQTVGPKIAGGVIGHIQGDSPVTVSIRGLHDLKDAIETDITIDSKKKAMEIQMKYDKAHPKNVLHIAAKYPSKTNLDVQVYRTGDKPQITDAVVKINLKTSRILHTKINWRPQAFKEMMDFGVQTLEKCGKSANDEFKSTAFAVEKELSAKYTSISTELETELKPYVDSLSESLLVVQKKLAEMKKHLNKMYKDNDMYVKDVTDGVKQKTSAALEFYKKSVTEMKNAVSKIRERINKLNKLVDYPFDDKYKEFVNEVSSKIQTCKQELVDTLKKETETLTKKMKETVESLRKDVQEMTDKIRLEILDLLDGVLGKAEVKELIAYVEDVLKSLPDGGNLPEIDWDYYIAKINTAIKQKLSDFDLDTVTNLVESSKTAVYDQLGPMMEDEQVKELKELVNNLQKKLKQAYKQWNIEKTIKSYLIDMYNDLQKYIKEDIAALKFLHWDKNRIIAFDPEHGNIEFEVYLPSPADTLESFPKLRIHKYVKKIDNLIKKIDALELPKLFDFSIWDFYYKYKPSWDPKDWVPPFDTFALVAGNQHFITFDQRQIDFAGRCSYILAKDLVDNKFTVIMNYNGKRRPEMKSLLVLAEGKSIEIFPDFSVKLDNRPTELPIKHEKLSVIRDGNLIQVDTGRGLIISGNLANQHIAFVLSGWYFGKVGGLLGSYDNEQYDDMIDRTGQVTKDINALAQTWEVASRCRNSANIASDVKVEAGQRGYVKCSKLFVESGSTLRPCFKVVDPAYFMKVCMAEMKTSKGDGCNAVSAYVKQCRQNDVMLWEPKQCISCRAPNKEFYEGGESIKLSPSSDDFQVPKSADVVMVVEQTGCNSNPVKHLGDLVDKLEQAFVKNEITNNRYGLIGFGGTPRSAFGRKSASVAHTFEGSIFSESNNFAKGKETLRFGYHFTDPLEAILTASDMPFRAGVSKTIVLIHCGECSDSKIVNYNHLKHVLSTRDITLHIIRDQDIRLTGNSSPKDVIMGFDRNTKYMMKPLPDMTSRDVRIPEDSCVSLSLMSDGSLFHSSGLTDRKIRNRKWFLNTVSKRISQTAKPDQCQVCQCVADHTGMAKSVCRTCYSNISDYLPNWWSTIKHPNKIQNQFEKQYKEYFGEDTWKVIDQL